jgi:tetratricopeptide (TPR) repeat protein
LNNKDFNMTLLQFSKLFSAILATSFATQFAPQLAPQKAFGASDSPAPEAPPAAGAAATTSAATAPVASSQADQVKALIDAEKFSEALALIETSDKKAESAEMQNLKGFALRKSGKPKEAIGAYKKALKLNPNFPQAKEYLGVAYLQTKKLKEAKDIYADLSKTAPEFAKMLSAEAEKMKIKL